MRATREKSHSQLGGPTSGWLWKNLRVRGSKSAHPTCVPPECREEIPLNVSSRGNCRPKGVTSPQMCLLDSNTNATKASPLLSYDEGKTCALGTWCFLEFPFSRFSVSLFLWSVMCL
uniref:Uncharacterized protein n=1 Tax=Saimiri boliviensis boliviensis TaxID=39432 RepID=A0A2K6SHJ9_SAIBB